MNQRPILFTILILIFFSCGKDKSVQLPETDSATITKIRDVSAAYLFYDVTQKDSVAFNRKNIIGTTNWLVNIDKRLTLKQILPHLVYLQHKRNKDGLHKNEQAKNYFTCSNPSITNLAFIEFTDVVYHEGTSNEYYSNTENQLNNKYDQFVTIKIHSLDSVIIEFFTKGCSLIQTSNHSKLLKDIELDTINNGEIIILLEFNQTLNFQEYITYKSLLLKLNSLNIILSSNEFIF